MDISFEMDTDESEYDKFLMPDDTYHIHPRIGNEYQADVPTFEADAAIDSYFDTEFPIPVMCVNIEGYPNTDQKNEGYRIDTKHNMMKGFPSENETYLSGNPQYFISKFETQLSYELDACRYQELTVPDDEIGHGPLPGTLNTFWSEAESQAFLLGLYILGKNLVKIRNFVEFKKMGDILAYYYGKFYSSKAYYRWSKLRKVRNKACIIRERIVKGFTQQELLSRLLPAMPKEVQNILLEVSEMFNNGRTSLENYVFTLKTKVGMNVLFDAIGIGKGEYDLTGMIPSGRMNRGTSFQLQTQTGKALSALSSGDICKLLNSGSWRSKAKSNYLFWGVVWPRLLARGWKLEQPVRASVLTYPFVFLAPGVKKFSRKELLKGFDYFDSICDVLSIVENDPGLLDPEGEGIKADISTNDEKPNLSSSLDHFLHPGVSICGSEDITIVDISMCQRSGIFKIRERISLNSDYTKTCSNATKTKIKREDSYSKRQDSNGCSPYADSAPFYSDYKGQEQNDFDHALLSTSLDDNKSVSRCIIENIPTEDMKLQFRHGAKTGQKAHSAPCGELRRSSSSNYEGSGKCAYSSSQRRHWKKQDESYQESAMFQETAEIAPEPESNGCLDGTAKCASSGVDPNSSIEIVTLGSEPMEQFSSHPSCQIDANPEVDNLPQANEKHDISEVKDTSMQVCDNQQISVDSRRKGTRKRHLTAKALEAHECGFLGNKRKRRDRRAKLPGTKAMRPASPARETVECSSPAPKVKIATLNSNFGVNGVNDGHPQSDSEREENLLN